MKPSKRCDKRGGGDVEGSVIDYCTCNCRKPDPRKQQKQSHAAPSLSLEDVIFSPGVRGREKQKTSPMHDVTIAAAEIKQNWMNASSQE